MAGGDGGTIGSMSRSKIADDDEWLLVVSSEWVA